MTNSRPPKDENKCLDCNKVLPKDYPFTFCDEDWAKHYPKPDNLAVSSSAVQPPNTRPPKLREQLDKAPCVQCDGSGGIQISEDEAEQCQFCWELRYPFIDQTQQSIKQDLLDLLPEKRKLIEPVTKRLVNNIGDKVGIDLEADTRGSLKFIQDNGFNQAIDQLRQAIIAYCGGEL